MGDRAKGGPREEAPPAPDFEGVRFPTSRPSSGWPCGSPETPRRRRTSSRRPTSRLDRHRAGAREVPIEDPDELERFSLYERIADEDPLPYSDHLHDAFVAQFPDEDVRRALLGLTQAYLVPLVLLYVEDLTYRELAEVLGCPMGTVMSRLHRGRKALERELWECAQRRGLIKVWTP